MPNNSLLIVPYGIEMRMPEIVVAPVLLLLIVPYGIEIVPVK